MFFRASEGTARRRVAWAALGVLALAGCATLVTGSRPVTLSARPPHGPLSSISNASLRSSTGGAYRAGVVAVGPVHVGRPHTLLLVLRDASGEAVADAGIEVRGAMPDGHALPSTPRVSPGSGEGTYRVEGVTFDRQGPWTVTFGISGPAGADRVAFTAIP